MGSFMKFMGIQRSERFYPIYGGEAMIEKGFLEKSLKYTEDLKGWK